MNKVLGLFLSAFVLVSCNMLKDSGKISLFPSKSLVAEQILTSQPIPRAVASSPKFQLTSLLIPVSVSQTRERGCSHVQPPIVAAIENHRIPDPAANHKPVVHGRGMAVFTSLPKQIIDFQNAVRHPLSESHVSRAHQAMTMDYGQVSSFFLVAGTIVILVAELIDPALLFTIGITIVCLALFISGVVLFWLWTKHKDNSGPWGISYGEFALMFFLGGLASLFFGGGILFYFSFLLLAGAILTFVLWLKHLNDEV